jgi:hypothetical protein
MTQTTRGASAPSIVVADDGSVQLRVHATTLHLDSSEFVELVTRALDALALVTRQVRRARSGGPLQ